MIAQLRLNLQTFERKNKELENRNQELENRNQNLVFEKHCLQKQLFQNKTTEDSAPVPKERASGSGSKTLETIPEGEESESFDDDDGF